MIGFFKYAHDRGDTAFAETSHRLSEGLLAADAFERFADSTTAGQLANHVDYRFFRAN